MCSSPRIGYRCYVKHQGQKDKTYIEFISYRNDTCGYETQKCTVSIWMNPILDLILPHRWIKNWIGRILYIKEKSIFDKENI